jgi:hypothetical protein
MIHAAILGEAISKTLQPILQHTPGASGAPSM